jgi:teichuronic acid biosynthesis glycosyltransferase TuaG
MFPANNEPIVVSVITPLFNASRFIPRLIQSVQNQIGINYEHIIVNDCSTDNSLALLELIADYDKRIKIINLKNNFGVVHARNVAISNANGRYLAFLDADDIWMPNKLKIQINFMRENDAALSFTDYRFISEDGNKVGRLLRGPSRISWTLHHMTRYLGCLTIVVDREKCPDFSFGDVSFEYRAEDFLAWSKIIKNTGPAIRCPYDLARYAVVLNSRSSSGLEAAKSVWRVYREIEKINFILSLLYFVFYVIFSKIKRFYFRPIWLRKFIDKY